MNVPLVTSTAEMLNNWCGPLVLADGALGMLWHDGQLWVDDDGPYSLGFPDYTSVFLDLRIPEARWRFCDVMFGSPIAYLVKYPAGTGLVIGDRLVAVSWKRVDLGGAPTVPTLATLPEEHQLAWALWEFWRNRSGQ